MKKLILSILITMAIPFINASCNRPSTKETSQKDKKVTVAAKDQYQCPMDTDVKSDKPGTCPKCGMDLEKVKK